MATRKIIAETTPATAGAAAAPARKKRASGTTHTSAHSRKATVTGAQVGETGMPPVAPPAAPIPHDEIARLAYALWEARGRTGGSPAEDWQRAEAELRQRR